LKVPNGPAPVWDSVLGDMRITEFWSVAYDAYNQRIFGGTQDNSNPEQNATGGIVYTDRLGGDGAIVQVEYRDTNNDGTLDLSNRYMSRQNFGGFSRIQFDGGNPGGVLTTVTMTVAGANGRTVNGAGTQPFGKRSRLRQADEFIVQCLSKRYAVMPGQRMVVGNVQYQSILAVIEHFQVPGSGAVGEDADVGAVFTHGGHDVAAGALFEADLDARVFAPETGQVVRKELDNGGSIRPDADLPPAACGEIGQRP